MSHLFEWYNLYSGHRGHETRHAMIYLPQCSFSVASIFINTESKKTTTPLSNNKTCTNSKTYDSVVFLFLFMIKNVIIMCPSLKHLTDYKMTMAMAMAIVIRNMNPALNK